MRAAHSRFGPSGQCASLAGSRGLFREKGLQGSVAAHPRGDWCVQQVAREEDRAFSRDLLKREDTSPERATGSRTEFAAPRSFNPAYDSFGSKLGHCSDVHCTTALPPKADVHPPSCYVAQVPIAT